jgi:phenylpropionate dioxygenase-like ring-hydroxylating dioxygenase large terminal subunit
MDDDARANARLSAGDLRPGRVVAVEVDGDDYVVWRGASGGLGSAPRWCPHLDHDLAEGHVAGDELVCPGHGWGFDGCGHAFKRNELGRVDPKGDVATLGLHEHDGVVDVERRSS